MESLRAEAIWSICAVKLKQVSLRISNRFWQMDHAFMKLHIHRFRSTTAAMRSRNVNHKLLKNRRWRRWWWGSMDLSSPRPCPKQVRNRKREDTASDRDHGCDQEMWKVLRRREKIGWPRVFWKIHCQYRASNELLTTSNGKGTHWTTDVRDRVWGRSGCVDGTCHCITTVFNWRPWHSHDT